MNKHFFFVPGRKFRVSLFFNGVKGVSPVARHKFYEIFGPPQTETFWGINTYTESLYNDPVPTLKK